MIPELRRKINDSSIGQKINHTVPGILVEGASREVSDALSTAAISATAFGLSAYSLFVKKRPLTALLSAILGVGVFYAKETTHENLETHYSHTSPLYMKTVSEGKEVMERIPMKHALIKRLYRNKPEKAAALIMQDIYDNLTVEW